MAARDEGNEVVSFASAQFTVCSLEQRVHNLAGSIDLAFRAWIGKALVVFSPMLPQGAIIGGSTMALRYGHSITRFLQYVDTPRLRSLERFKASSRSPWRLPGPGLRAG